MTRRYTAALEAALLLPALIEQDRIRREHERREAEMFEPGGLKCHVWPEPLVRAYAVVRWATDSRQQRRARERAR